MFELRLHPKLRESLQLLAIYSDLSSKVGYYQLILWIFRLKSTLSYVVYIGAGR